MSKLCQNFVKTLSKLCQKLVKIIIDYQIVTEIYVNFVSTSCQLRVKNLSKTCQKLVKKNKSLNLFFLQKVATIKKIIIFVPVTF